jgi:hypothetical protein
MGTVPSALTVHLFEQSNQEYPDYQSPATVLHLFCPVPSAGARINDKEAS